MSPRWSTPSQPRVRLRAARPRGPDPTSHEGTPAWRNPCAVILCPTWPGPLTGMALERNLGPSEKPRAGVSAPALRMIAQVGSMPTPTARNRTTTPLDCPQEVSSWKV